MTRTNSQLDLHNASPTGRVMRWVADSIETKRLVPGAPIPAERRLAERLKVSRTSVRAALDILQNQGLVEQPADGRRRRVASGRRAEGSDGHSAEGVLSDTIALLSQRTPSAAGTTLNQVALALDAASRQIEAAGCHALLVHPTRLEQRGVGTFAAMGVKGLLVIDEVDASPMIQDLLDACRGRVPVVVRGYGPESRKYDRVISDHEGGTYQATRWMIERGRRRILRFWRVSGNPAWLALRDAGYERAMREAGLEPLPPIVLPELPNHGKDEAGLSHYARLYAGYLLEHVKGPEPIDAALVVTDSHAYQLNASLRLLGREPGKDVWVGGFDNLFADEPWSQWEPVGPTITVDKNNEAGGRMMVELLDQRIAGELPDEPVCRVAPAKLITTDESEQKLSKEDIRMNG